MERTKFETHAIQYLTQSDTIPEVAQRYKLICTVCTSHRPNKDCQKCKIATTHSMVAAILTDNMHTD